MISIADTYDVMTARDSYRDPVSQAEAIAELRRVSGAQLDGDLVEAFIRVVERSGLAVPAHTDADFEASSTSTPGWRALQAAVQPEASTRLNSTVVQSPHLGMAYLGKGTL